MKRTLYIFLFLAPALFCSACSRFAEVNFPEHDPESIIHAFWTPDSLFQVHVGSTISVTQPDTLLGNTEAQVLVFEQGKILDTLRHRKNGYYYSSQLKPQSGHSYTLQVNTVTDTLIARDKVPQPVEILRLDIEQGVLMNDQGDVLDKVNITFQDPPGQLIL
jgi:hypothetical protein